MKASDIKASGMRANDMGAPDLVIDQLRDLAAWMDVAGIDQLELTGPSFQLRLTGGDVCAQIHQSGSSSRDTASPPVRHVVTASTVGLFLHCHPLHTTMLAPEGARVRAGQVLGLLRIGPLLVPVVAPWDATVGTMLVADETIVGFGTGLVELHPLER